MSSMMPSFVGILRSNILITIRASSDSHLSFVARASRTLLAVVVVAVFAFSRSTPATIGWLQYTDASKTVYFNNGPGPFICPLMPALFASNSMMIFSCLGPPAPVQRCGLLASEHAEEGCMHSHPIVICGTWKVFRHSDAIFPMPIVVWAFGVSIPCSPMPPSAIRVSPQEFCAYWKKCVYCILLEVVYIVRLFTDPDHKQSHVRPSQFRLRC